MKILGIAVTLVFASPQLAAVHYYATDNLASIDPNKWTVTGKVAPGPSGLSAPDQNGGSLISRISIPDGTGEAEVAMTLTLSASGGVYSEFLQATPDAHTGGVGSGSYLAFEMQHPKFDASGNCVANFLVLQSAAGNVTVLAAFQHACRNGMLMRMAAQNGVVLVWPDQATPAELFTTLGVGMPGVGAYATPAGNAISLVQFGAIDRVPLPGINDRLITASAFRNRTGVQWPAVQVGANSSGLNGYWIYRDGSYLMRTVNNSFVDESVSPGAKHTYTIYVVNQHFIPSSGASATISSPVAQSKNGSPPPATAPKK